jgi:putative NADPH-quinone reductase
MTVLVILAHPSAESFNHALAMRAKAALETMGRRVIFHDLYREGFDPLLPAAEIMKGGTLDPVVLRHCREVSDSGGIVFIHPNWWGGPPAILKGWIDRVLRPGVAYRFCEGDTGEGVPEGLLAGKRVLVLNTADTPEEREKVYFGDPLESMWRQCICGFCDITRYRRRVFSVVVASTDRERQEWLDETSTMVREFFS